MKHIMRLNGVLLGCLAAGYAMSTQYSLAEIPITPTAINNWNQIVGYATSTSGWTHAFYYYDGVSVDLGTLGGTQSKAYGINDNGTICGMAYTGTDLSGARPFSSNGLGIFSLGSLGGGYGQAYSVNSSGEVVGTSNTSLGLNHSFAYTGSLSDIGTLGGSRSTAFGVNDAGDATGTSNVEMGTSPYYAYIYKIDPLLQQRRMYVIDSLGGTTSAGLSINSSLTVVGYSFLSGNQTQHGFLFDNESSTVYDIGTLGGPNSRANCINSSGVFVGYSDTTSGYQHGVIGYGIGTPMIYDLNSMLDSTGTGYMISSAVAINNGGVIVAIAIKQGYYKNVVLTPHN